MSGFSVLRNNDGKISKLRMSGFIFFMIIFIHLVFFALGHINWGAKKPTISASCEKYRDYLTNFESYEEARDAVTDAVNLGKRTGLITAYSGLDVGTIAYIMTEQGYTSSEARSHLLKYKEIYNNGADSAGALNCRRKYSDQQYLYKRSVRLAKEGNGLIGVPYIGEFNRGLAFLFYY